MRRLSCWPDSWGRCRGWTLRKLPPPSRPLVRAPIPIATLNRAKPVDFAGEILPILAKNCLACHNASEAEGELVLESPESIRKGGESGAAVVPGQGAASRLLQAAAHQEDLVMPPPDNKVGALPFRPNNWDWSNSGSTRAHSGEVGPPRVVVRRPMPLSVRPILATAITPDDELVACNRGDRLFVYDLRGPRLAAELADPCWPVSKGRRRPGPRPLARRARRPDPLAGLQPRRHALGLRRIPHGQTMAPPCQPTAARTGDRPAGPRPSRQPRRPVDGAGHGRRHDRTGRHRRQTTGQDVDGSSGRRNGPGLRAGRQAALFGRPRQDRSGLGSGRSPLRWASSL